MPGPIILLHSPHASCAGGNALLHALFNDRRALQVGFDLPVAPASDIHALMSDLFRKHGLFAADFTYQVITSLGLDYARVMTKYLGIGIPPF